MNISFYDGINDGKFFNISAGKYDDLDDIDDINVDDIDISTEVEEDEEDDANTCLNRFAALEKDVSKIHMNLNNLRNEFKGSCKDWNDLSDTVDHMLNNIAELKTIMNRADDRLNKRLNVISEANVVLTDKLNLVEKKLEVFKCIDILDRVTKLEEQIKPTVLEEAKELEVNPSVLNDILDRLGNILDRLRKLEEDSVSTRLKVANVVSKDIRDDVRLHSIDLKLKKLEDTKCDKVSPSVADDILDRLGKLEEKAEILDGKYTTCHNSNKLAIGRLYERLGKIEPKLAETAKIVEAVEDKIYTVDTINNTISGYDYAILSDRINELESKLEKLSYVEPTPGCVKGEIYDSVNHPSHYTDGKYECIDFIEEYGTITHIGNTIKYASRAGKKDEDAYIEDLKKGLWYLHRYNCPPKKKHIDVLDYCKDKKLPDELTNVLIAISRENYVEAERVLRKYIEELKK